MWMRVCARVCVVWHSSHLLTPLRPHTKITHAQGDAYEVEVDVAKMSELVKTMLPDGACLFVSLWVGLWGV